jgi:hypothetical protein
LNDHKNGAGQSVPHGHVQPEKRLARGLEEVSSLFLSQATSETIAGAGIEDNPTQNAHLHREEPATAALIRPFAGMNRDRLISLLQDQSAVLEEGVRTIDANVPCDSYGPIDLIAVDAANHLSVIDIDDAINDALLLRALCHFDWIVRNVPILRRMYRGQIIDFSADPRLFLIAPEYSLLMRCAARRIAHPQITCFAYRSVALPNGVGILVERA